MKSTIYIHCFLFLNVAYATGPCNEAVQLAKNKCGPFVGRSIRQAEELESKVPDIKKRCGELVRLKPGNEQEYQRICEGAKDEAVAKCGESVSGGISGQSGFTTTADELNDLNLTFKELRKMFDNNWGLRECPAVPMS